MLLKNLTWKYPLINVTCRLYKKLALLKGNVKISFLIIIIKEIKKISPIALK